MSVERDRRGAFRLPSRSWGDDAHLGQFVATGRRNQHPGRARYPDGGAGGTLLVTSPSSPALPPAIALPPYP